MNDLESMSILTTRRDVHRIIATIMPRFLDASIDENLHLKDLGADSVDRVEIIMALLDKFNLTVPMSEFSGMKNVRGLIEFIHTIKGASE